MAQDETEDRRVSDVTSRKEGDAGRQVALVTGMSEDAARTFAAFLSGRFASRPSFPDAT